MIHIQDDLPTSISGARHHGTVTGDSIAIITYPAHQILESALLWGERRCHIPSHQENNCTCLGHPSPPTASRLEDLAECHQIFLLWNDMWTHWSWGPGAAKGDDSVLSFAE